MRDVTAAELAGMTDQERKRLANEIRETMANLTRTADLLSPPDVGSKAKKSPDGGPLSHAHRFMTTQRLLTVKVRRVEDGDDGETFIINESDFRADVYVRVDAPARRPIRQTVAEIPSKVFSAHSREEMLTMTVATLRKLPEYAEIELPSPKKDLLVDQILEVRKASTGTANPTPTPEA